MAQMVIVTHNVSSRMRGFLASSTLEISPGTYCSPKTTPAIRERIWSVLTKWFDEEKDSSVVMLWEDKKSPGGQQIRTLGTPSVSFVEVDGLILTKR